MKKIMFGLAAAIAMVAAADIVSANVVGYTKTASGSQNNFVSVPFLSVGFNTSDIQLIKIDDGGAGSIGWGTETFDVWAGLPEVVEGTSFIYTDPSMDPEEKATDYYWADFEGNAASFSIAAGQGVVLGLAEGLNITYAGDVGDAKIEFTSIAGNNFVGNSFAAALNIQAIKIDDDGAGSIGWGTETFDVWAGLPEVVEGTSFIYTDPSMDPEEKATDYYWADFDGNAASYTIDAGKGFVLGLAEGLKVTIDAPYAL